MSDCPNQKYSVSLKPRANKCNIVGQHLPTLLDVTCCVRLHILLHVVGCCWELLCSFVRSNVAGGHLGLIVIYLFKAYARNTTTEAPSTSIRFCLKTEIFFSGLAYRRGGSRIFLGGGALVSCSVYFNTNKPQNTSCIRKPQVISGGGATPCTLPLDPPLLPSTRIR